MTKRELKAEVVRLTYRVQELEERLCPCESHDWKHTKTDWEISYPNDVDEIYTYKCKRCGKARRTWEPFLERKEDNHG